MAAVPVERVLALCNPLQSWPWCSDAPGQVELERLVRTASPEPSPVCATADATRHAGRIRFLMENGWSDAIEVDVGVPVLGYAGPNWPVTDGNHRLAAAALRGDHHIEVSVAGQLNHAATLLGVPERTLFIRPESSARCGRRRCV